MDCRLYLRCWALAAGCWLISIFSLAQTTNQQWRDSLSVLNKQIEQSTWSTDLHLRKATVNLELRQWEYAIDEYAAILQRLARQKRPTLKARNDYELRGKLMRFLAGRGFEADEVARAIDDERLS